VKPASAAFRPRRFVGWWQRIGAGLIKEFLQLRRDRVTCALIVLAPLTQLTLYGYAVNTTPRHMPTAVLLREQNDVSRSILKALENTAFFEITHQARDGEELDRLVEMGTVLFAIEIPYGFERAVRRGEQPALLMLADATDPIAANAALAALRPAMQNALRHDRLVPIADALPFDVRVHARYNPAGVNSFNVVPGLVGTILTMTMMAFTALSVSRENERGTIELLLSMPITPVQIMLGKILPYVIVGLMQAAIIILVGIGLFGVPLRGSVFPLALLSMLFISANLAVGYTISSFSKSQLQAMQICSMFVLPNILLSGFLFPFSGMPRWAQWIGEFLPLTHYLRIMRAIMLKGTATADLYMDALALTGLMLIAMTIAVARFRRTLD
jgi:ABC-2 type transport system permease protein